MDNGLFHCWTEFNLRLRDIDEMSFKIQDFFSLEIHFGEKDTTELNLRSDFFLRYKYKTVGRSTIFPSLQLACSRAPLLPQFMQHSRIISRMVTGWARVAGALGPAMLNARTRNCILSPVGRSRMMTEVRSVRPSKAGTHSSAGERTED